ncbi:hypothetical protein [Dickeya undicola]|uniref:hypothetical protein n=1 Tax=Dickeya undicola TaxID=1577887 RepID=UPI000532D4DE|nr:hypothetical protein [Dickeya undicola]
MLINQQGIIIKCQTLPAHLFIIILFIPFITWSSEIVHGPFTLGKNSEIIFIEEDKNNVVLLQKNKYREYAIDTYETEGSKAHIETVFFINLESVMNIIVLVSWKQYHPSLGIDGVLYEIKGYSYINGILKVNESLLKDNNLSGFDGVKNDSHFVYKYKNAETIKEYLKKTH